MSEAATAVLVTLGSIGDLLPFLAVGKALRRRGRHVVIATHEEYGGACRAAGLEFRAVWDGRTSQRAFDEVLNSAPETLWCRLWADFFLPAAEPTAACLQELAAAGPTAVIAAWSALGARLASARTGAPLCTVYLSPDALQRGREAWTCPGGAAAHGSELSLAFFPDWFAAARPCDLGGTIPLGFPLHEDALVPVSLATLRRFVDAGDPPVVFTPGSFMDQGDAFFRAAVTACERLDRRAVFLTPHRRQLPARLPDRVLHLDYVPLHRILPAAAAIFHHGGIGTTAQALRAGVPQVVAPVFFDQFDNAARVEALGAGIDLRRHSPDADAIVGAIASLPTRDTGSRLADVAARFAPPDPADAVCELLDAWLDRRSW